MGLFNHLFNGKKGEKATVHMVYSPIKGTSVELAQVADPVFAEGTMGLGGAIIPDEGELYSPVTGKIIALFPTSHALGILSEDGLEVLLHIGIDTVEMKGDGFQAHVNIDQQVSKGQHLISFDIQKIKEQGYDPTVMVVVSNSGEFGKIKLHDKKQITNGEQLFWFDQ